MNKIQTITITVLATLLVLGLGGIVGWAARGHSTQPVAVKHALTIRPKHETKIKNPVHVTHTPPPVAAPLPILVVGSYAGREPQEISFSEDGGDIVTNISWSAWNAHSAYGTGTSVIQSCNPSCAAGTDTPVTTTITLTDPVNGKFTALAELRDGQLNTEWPLSVAQTDEQFDGIPPLPAGATMAPGYSNVACGNGNSYLLTGGQWIIDHDDPSSSPCNQ